MYLHHIIPGPVVCWLLYSIRYLSQHYSMSHKIAVRTVHSYAQKLFSRTKPWIQNEWNYFLRTSHYKCYFQQESYTNLFVASLSNVQGQQKTTVGYGFGCTPRLVWKPPVLYPHRANLGITRPTVDYTKTVY